MFLVGSIIRNQYITSIGLFYKNWEDCGGCLAVPEQPLVRTAELRLERTWLI